MEYGRVAEERPIITFIAYHSKVIAEITAANPALLDKWDQISTCILMLKHDDERTLLSQSAVNFSAEGSTRRAFETNAEDGTFSIPELENPDNVGRILLTKASATPEYISSAIEQANDDGTLQGLKNKPHGVRLVEGDDVAGPLVYRRSLYVRGRQQELADALVPYQARTSIQIFIDSLRNPLHSGRVVYVGQTKNELILRTDQHDVAISATGIVTRECQVRLVPPLTQSLLNSCIIHSLTHSMPRTPPA